MTMIDGGFVRTCNAILLWDGITQPETDPKDGTVKHTAKVAIPGNAQELSELTQIATDALNASQHFKGQLPPGGNWPIREVDTSKFGDSAPLLQGHYAINAKTRRGAPKIFDSNGQELGAMQFGQMLYPGCVVQLLVSAYDFNNVSKGISYQLEGMMIADATAPRLDVGGGLSESQVAGAFGFGGGGGAAPSPAPAQPAAPSPAPAQPAAPSPSPGSVEPHPDFVANAGAPAAPAAPAPAAPAPAGPQMTEKAAGISYDQFIAAGWTDELLRSHGYMQ